MMMMMMMLMMMMLMMMMMMLMVMMLMMMMMMLMMMMMMMMFMFKFKRLLNMKMDKTVPGRSAHRRSCAGLVGESDVLLLLLVPPDLLHPKCCLCITSTHITP